MPRKCVFAEPLNLIKFLCSSRIVIFAGDVSPVEMICHLPAVCEEKSIPYVYVPSKADLGAAMGVKRASVTILIREHADYQELFDECKQELSALPIPV